MRQPNIVLFFTDQQRFDALSCAGNSELNTPNIDALAASGVRFSQACTSTPICVAARMSMAFGHRVARTHWVDNQKLPGPAPELPSIMTLLHDAGYVNHCVGKTHFRHRHYGFHRVETSEEVIHSVADDDYLMYLRDQDVRTRHQNGFRDLLYFQPQTSGIPKEHHKTSWVTERSVDFLRRHTRYNSTRPFFLMTSWTAPHPPFAPCEPYDEMYDPAGMALPVFSERHISTLPATAWGHRGRLDRAHLDPDRMRRIRALYYGLVSQVDEGVGRVMDELRSLGIDDNTVIIFTSDHGDMLGDHGLSQKNVPYEHSVRVPLIMHWPGRTAAGKTCEDLVGLTDVLPTIMHGCGLEYPVSEGPLPGSSLLSATGGGLGEDRDAFAVDYGHGRNRWVSLRGRRYKYAWWASGGREELFDLQDDPWETANLAASEPDLAAAYRHQVEDWERRHGFNDSFDEGELRAYEEPALPPDDYAMVAINDGKWADNLPPGECDRVETFAEGFTRAISKETSLSPEKLSIGEYKQKGGDLRGTPWEEAWKNA
jgi:arylsulfatase